MNKNASAYKTGKVGDVPSPDFLTSWIVCGPFPSPDGSGFDRDFLTARGGEQKIEPQPGLTHAFGGQTRRWKQYGQDPQNKDRDFVNLALSLSVDEYLVGYAFCFLRAKDDTILTFHIGSDDGIKIWLNHALVHHANATRSAKRDQELVSVKLHKGLNPCLVKVDQKKGGWGFFLQAADEKAYDAYIRRLLAKQIDPKSWKMENGAELTQNGDELTISWSKGWKPAIWQPVTVDLDKTPAMALNVSRMENLETIEALFRNSALTQTGYLLESTAPGKFLIPLRGVVGSAGIQTFELGIGLRNEFGKGSATFSAIRLVAIEEDLLRNKPGAPRLITPLAGTTVTNFAVEFRWQRCEHAAAYEVQYADNINFSNACTERIATAGGGYYALYITPIPFLPENAPKAGKCFWRVRGFNSRNEPGPWSAVGSFSVDDKTEPKAREINIAPCRPLITLDNFPWIDFATSRVLTENVCESLPVNWRSLPDEIKNGNVLLNICYNNTDLEKYCKICDVAEANGIPLLLQIASWPGIVDKGDHYSTSLSEAEYLFQHYPSVKALRLVEQSIVFWGGAARAERLNYIVNLTRLAAKYGKIVIWAELCDAWAELAADSKFMHAIAAYKDYFVPVWKETLPPRAHRAQSALLGLWLSDLVANWGVHADEWWWIEAGFISEHSAKATQQAPGSLYGLVWMTGISAGATVYNIENGWNIWDPPGQLTDKMKHIVIPLIRDMNAHGLIPERKEVLQKTRLAGRPGDGDVKQLFESAYTLRHPYQFIPATGRYFWIPLLPDHAPQSALDLFDEVIGPDLLAKPEKIRSLLDRCYPEKAEGNAWAVKAGQRMFAMQSHENKAEEQTFAFNLQDPFVSLKGTLDSHSYVIAKQEEDLLFLHVQRGRANRVRLEVVTANRQPDVAGQEFDASQNIHWDTSRHLLEIVIDQPAAASIEIKLS